VQASFHPWAISSAKSSTKASPIGHVTGAIGNPNGEAILAVKNYVRKAMGGGDEEDEEEEEGDAKGESKQKSDKAGGESIGGNAKTGQNALGL